MPTSQRLPRGRNALPPEEVARLHCERLCRAMAEVMVEKGYVGTSVEDILKRAGVSRLSFYKLFSSKLDCFMTALDFSAERLLRLVADALGAPGAGTPRVSGSGGDPLERYERAIGVYFETLEKEWPFTRLCLVEAYAAGPEAVAHRGKVQGSMADVHAAVLGATDERGLLTCRMLAAATIALVTVPVAQNDRESLRAVRPQLVAYVRSLWESGAFGAGTGPA